MPPQPLADAPADAVWDLLRSHVRPGPTVVRDPERCLGRVLAADVRAAFDFPPFDRGMMDGFAVCCADFAHGGATLRNVGLIRAGVESVLRVSAGTCAQINTGAPLPVGADAVVVVEKSEPAVDGCVRLADAPRPGQHVEPRAHVAKKGDLLVRGGTRVGPGTAAAIAAAGAGELRVFAAPRVGLLTTGDEIVPGGAERSDPQVYNSNRIMLSALIDAAHATTVDLGHAPDEADRLRGMLARGLEYELLCVTGGMSKGSHDLVPAALEQIGVEWLVTSLHLKPGKPTRIGRTAGGCWVLGLPGNPVSCAVCLLLFGRAILDGLEGLPIARPPHPAGTLEAPMPANGSRPLYQPGEWHAAPDGSVRVAPLTWRGSGDPFGLSVANALIYRDAHAGPAAAGQTVPFIPLDVPR